MKNIIRLTVLFSMCAMFTFCTSNTILKKPDNLLSKDKMADVLTDVLLADGGENIKNLNNKRKVNYFPIVYQKHQIDSLQFEESTAFYISRIDDYNDILKVVNKRLNSKKDELKALKKIEDSIKRAKRELKRNRLQPKKQDTLQSKANEEIIKE